MVAPEMIDIAAFARDFEERYDSRPRIFSAPGRVNLIGEHTDYNDGFVLPFAIDKRTYVGCSPRKDNILSVYSRTIDEGVAIDLKDDERKKGWSLYVRGMAEVLRRRGMVSSGADLLIDSEIPFGAGLSSSAALEVSVGLALATLSGKDIDRVDLAFAGQEVEHQYIGVRSGIMDQFTSALAQKDNALLIDCRSLAFQNIPLVLGDLALMVCDSKVEHELADSAYNERRSQCEDGVKLLRQRFPNVSALRDVTAEQLNEADDLLPETIAKRCRHVVSENARTLESAEALEKSDFRRLGLLMYESHESLKDDYEVTCDELDMLVDAARTVDGVVGARMTGGGFGGCTINLIRRGAVEMFVSSIADRFRQTFGRETEIFPVTPSDGAHAERLDASF
jgi:galactokinase